WGYNNYGQIGIGTTENQTVPAKVNDDEWSSVRTGFTHVCGIKKADSSLYCWGGNVLNQIGDGTYDTRLAPVKVGSGAWSSISTGRYSTCGIKSDNKLFCWGDTSYGQLGIGPVGSNDTTVPVSVGGKTWKKVSIASSHACAIESDSSLYCWGRNSSGELGDGTAWSEEPVLVAEP
ncbi:MAG TPA: hypothetical protein P5044_08450, partial [bacterium]|nr:hypothetical protein [bacterium]